MVPNPSLIFLPDNQSLNCGKKKLKAGLTHMNLEKSKQFLKT